MQKWWGMNFLEMDEEKILSIVGPLMGNWLNGSNENNHAKHVKGFTERIRNIVTPENLKMQLSHEPRAFFTNRKFVHLFRRQSSICMVGKQFISTTDDELMNQVIFVEKGGKILIDHCMVC